MRYQESVAYQSDVATPRRERLVEQDARASFEVVTGGGLDAQARRGVTSQFVARLRAILVVAAVLIALGAVRVALTSATVSVLEDNATLKTQISATQAANDDLRIARSVLSSNSRISRIATQNLGMVLPTSRETVTISSGDAADAAADAAAATDAAAPDAASQTDGNAAQASDAATDTNPGGVD